MTVSSSKVLQGFYNATKAIGAKSINSDAYMEIEGYEHLGLFTKQFPWPTTGSQGEIESPGPMGSKSWEIQQIATAMQGPVTFNETLQGHISQFLEDIAIKGGKFNAIVYEGTPDRFTRAYKVKDCFFVPDAVDRDWENRAQLSLINGTLFYHYFGEKIAGNYVP